MLVKLWNETFKNKYILQSLVFVLYKFYYQEISVVTRLSAYNPPKNTGTRCLWTVHLIFAGCCCLSWGAGSLKTHMAAWWPSKRSHLFFNRITKLQMLMTCDRQDEEEGWAQRDLRQRHFRNLWELYNKNITTQRTQICTNVQKSTGLKQHEDSFENVQSLWIWQYMVTTWTRVHVPTLSAIHSKPEAGLCASGFDCDVIVSPWAPPPQWV